MKAKRKIHLIESGVFLAFIGYVFLLLSPLIIFSDVVFVAVAAFVLFSIVLLVVSETFEVWNKYKDMDKNDELNKASRLLADKLEMDPADIVLVEDPFPNAYVVSGLMMTPKIIFTTGLVELLTKKELVGVMTHNYSHIKTRDNIFMLSLWQVIIYCTKVNNNMKQYMNGTDNNKNPEEEEDVIERILGLVISIPLITLLTVSQAFLSLIFYSVSRKRELFADSEAVSVIPKHILEDSLIKLHESTGGYTNELSLHSAESFIPVKNSEATILRTHPSLERRVQNLEEVQDK